jgi:hypothetical protein
MWARSAETARPPRVPAMRASSELNSCARPCAWAALPPLLAMAFWSVESIEANPRRLFFDGFDFTFFVFMRLILDLSSETSVRVFDTLLAKMAVVGLSGIFPGKVFVLTGRPATSTRDDAGHPQLVTVVDVIQRERVVFVEPVGAGASHEECGPRPNRAQTRSGCRVHRLRNRPANRPPLVGSPCRCTDQ